MAIRIPKLPLIALFLLLIPLIAMQFTDQVNWSVMDFVIMGVLLLAVGFVADLILRRIKNAQNRLVYIVLLLLVFLLVWAEMAVGIFGTPLAGS